MISFHVLFDAGEITCVADIDDGLHDVVQIGSGFIQQGGDVFNHTFRLLDDISRMYDLTIPVDAGGTGNEHMAAVAIRDGRSPFKSHAIFIRPAQVVGGIEILNLFLSDTRYGIRVHCHENIGILIASLNAGTGNKMSVFCQVLCSKYIFAGFDDSRIIHVYVLNKYPGTDTVVCQRAVGGRQLHDIIAEDKPCLILRIGSTVAQVSPE